MSKVTPIIKTTFKVPPRQGKDIYSPIQQLISKHKMPGLINSDTTLNRLIEIKAKFKMITQNDR